MIIKNLKSLLAHLPENARVDIEVPDIHGGPGISDPIVCPVMSVEIHQSGDGVGTITLKP